MSDRVLRFPDRTWDELEGLPQPLRSTAHRAIFHLLEEPVPALAEPFPEADPLPGAYRLHLPSDGLTIWYTVTESPRGQVVIIVQYVKADTWTSPRRTSALERARAARSDHARPSVRADAPAGPAAERMPDRLDPCISHASREPCHKPGIAAPPSERRRWQHIEHAA